ncbi:MAG: YdeI/OmpD-associated family protein [Planctomycetota bacterium]
MSKPHPEVTAFLKSIESWKRELTALRKIARDCGLNEDWKWRQPCYTHEGRNIAILSHLKSYCAISFFNGALLSNEHGRLVAPGKNSQFTRLIKFTSVAQILEAEPVLRDCIAEAIDVEKSGRKVETKPVSEYEVPDELRAKFDEDPAFRVAFESLTPGRRKGYLLHFTGAKQSKSRAARIEKYTRRIMDGKGIRDCVCGHSARFPSCDGSHKDH